MNTLQSADWLPAFVTPFITLSYPVDTPARTTDSFTNASYYSNGLLDGCFIVTCIAIMAVLRDALRLGVFEPFAKWWLTRRLRRSKALQNARANGHSKGEKANGATNGHAAPSKDIITKQEAKTLHRSVVRFAEQGWSVVYYSCQWSYGVYVHRHLPTAILNPIHVWIDYPHLPLAGPLKFYYLTQSAFYLHQILILNAEARRKDHWQMMTHHIITVVLMFGSYSYNYTRVGCLVMMLMDFCDIFLPLAKMFRYLSLSTLCDATFVCFLLSWLVTRHFLFLFVIKSTYSDAPRLLPPVWDPSLGHFMTKEVLMGFNAMLICLQILQIMWFWMICRVAYRVVSGQGAEDSRSDDEFADSGDDDENTKKDR